MGNKPKLKPGKNELIRRTNVLMGEAQKAGNWLNYLNNLLVRYIEYKGDTEKFGKFLEEIENADKEKSRKLHESSSTDNKTGNKKSRAKGRKKESTKENSNTTRSSKPKSTGESGNIGL